MPDEQQIVSIPAPPRPPAEYSLDYGDQLNRWLTSLVEQLTGFRLLRGSGLYLLVDGVPTSGAGLKPGMVFSNNGVLTLVRSDDVALGSLSMTAEVGTITVP